jgi:DNA-binding MarR family transcriptional regulator
MQHIKTIIEKRVVRTSNGRVRSIRTGGWYWVHKQILTRHGHNIRASGIAVYSVLALLANTKTQSCFPTHKTVARIAGVSKRTVSRRIRQLEEAGLIRREKQNRGAICYLLESEE